MLPFKHWYHSSLLCTVQLAHYWIPFHFSFYSHSAGLQLSIHDKRDSDGSHCIQSWAFSGSSICLSAHRIIRFRADFASFLVKQLNNGTLLQVTDTPGLLTRHDGELRLWFLNCHFRSFVPFMCESVILFVSSGSILPCTWINTKQTIL